MTAFDEQIALTLAGWKAKLREVRAGQPRDGDPLGALQSAARELETDLAAIEARLLSEGARAAACEARAMAAIRKADDAAARNALRERQQIVEGLEQLEADTTVLRAMLAECRLVLAQHTE
jgi:phage shock protein A